MQDTTHLSLFARLPVACLFVLVFTVFIGFWPVFISGDYSSAGLLGGSGDMVRQVSFALVFLLIVLTTLYRHGASSLWNVSMPLLLLLGWCWISIVWAIEPAIALRRVLFTTMVALSVTYSVNMLSYRTVLTVFGIAFAVILAADWLAVATTTQALHQAGELDPALVGNWRGIHSHKNEAGAFCALASIIFLNLSLHRRSHITGPVLTIVAILFLLMTQSKTSIGFVTVAMFGAASIVLCFRNPALRLSVFLSGPCALLLILLGYGNRVAELVAVFDNPASLTGRVQIWPVLFQYASDHLLLGSGYGSFWAIGDSSPIYDFDAGWLTTITHAHNGYLDMLVQTGLVGAVIVIASMVIWPLYLLLVRPLPRSWSRWLLAAILLFCWMHNLLETSLLDRANIVWVMLVVAYTLLQRGVAEAARGGAWSRAAHTAVAV